MNDSHPGDEGKIKFARKVLQRKARDHARTPMQWTDGPNAGFCKDSIYPWMRVNDDYKTVNVDAQRTSKRSDLSVLQFWKEALTIRKSDTDTFIYGDYQLESNDKTPVFAYTRTSSSASWIVALNFSGTTQKWIIPANLKIKEWQLGNYDVKPEQTNVGQLELRPWEGILGKAEPR